MQLTESQLFTIEALNRIEGFVWPDGATSAGVVGVPGGNLIHFFSGDCWLKTVNLTNVVTEKPDWRNSLITREQFDSVDGWVRNDGYDPKVSCIDIRFESGVDEGSYNSSSEWSWVINDPETMPRVEITHWRYHKSTKEAGAHNPEPKRPTLLEILVRELPRRGGWPKGALFMIQDRCGLITHFGEHIEARCIDGDWCITSDNELGEPFPVSMLSCDYSTKIVNRYEYLIEAAKAHDNIRFIADDECKPQKQEATTEQQPKSLDQLFAERKKMMTDLSVTRSNLSIINYEIKALLTAQGWTK